jgi:nucleotide-binding universal stress UspA family protein
MSFLDRVAAPLVVDLEGELERMGRFQLALACEQAAAQGVEAQAVVRRGHLRAELAAAARDLGATLIILGSPREGAPVFEKEDLHSFAAHLQSETGAEVPVL